MMDVKFLVVGKSSSGKDTLVNYVCEELGLQQLKSCTTRPVRCENENTHVFITPEESKLIQSVEEIIAYTKIGKFEYFATYSQFINSDIYIIDPNGVQYLKDKYEQELLDDGIRLVIIYIYTDDDLRVQRAMLRNNDIRVYNQRCIDEAEQFNKFEDCIDNYDFIIYNNNGEHAKRDIKWVVELYNSNK